MTESDFLQAHQFLLKPECGFLPCKASFPVIEILSLKQTDKPQA